MSDLQKRLTHLVNYSSQLIFVGSDAVADQQTYLTDFLSYQGDHTEVSFFTAKQDDKSVDHRRTICRQLADHQVGSFIRPIGELLADLPDTDTSYLICVAQADNITNDFLEELWQWIASIRKSASKLHINVILFGSASWAETAQNWLPQQNQTSPVLLSSHSVDAVGFDVNALESLMAQKRAFFAGKGIFSTSNGDSFVRRRWFISAVMCTFLIVFSVLITWQYPEEIKAFIDSGEIPDKVHLSLVPKPKELNSDKVILEVDENESTSITDELLVSDWAVYVEEINKPPEKSLENDDDQIEAPETTANSINILTRSIDTMSEVRNTTNSEAVFITPKVDAEGDFKVPDILSVEQLDAKLGQTIYNDDAPPNIRTDYIATSPSSELGTVDAESEAAQIDIKIEAETTKTSIEPVDTSGIDQYRFDEALLLQLPNDQVVLQLSGIQNPTVLETFISSNNLKESTWIYQTERYGGPWYVVLYNDTFDSIDSALSTVSSLPESVRRSQPFAKSITQIRNEITQ